ncbi:hypothetical protein MMC20_000564 [Loxospora ochrophaea]|nr:hypothetical protein [Loxospora ochrophaea]
MDGDHSAKTMEQGANSAMKDQEFTSGVHESINQIPSAGEKTTGTGTSMFSKDGAVGSMFNGTFLLSSHPHLPSRSPPPLTPSPLDPADGPLGGTAQKVGGPFDKEGSIGQHFNADGAIGGAFQENVAGKKA